MEDFYINYLEFFSMVDLLLHVFNYAIIYINVGSDIYCKIMVKIQYYFIYVAGQIAPALGNIRIFLGTLATENSCQLVPVLPWLMTYYQWRLFFLVWFFVCISMSLLSDTKRVPGSSCLFPGPILESAIPPRSTGSFHWRITGTKARH